MHELCLRRLALHYGLVIERGPLGFLAHAPGSRACFTLGHDAERALARLIVAVSTTPARPTLTLVEA